MTNNVPLPQPQTAGQMSVEQAIQQRRSRRAFADTPLRLAELAQVLWAAQGITGPSGRLRAAPSAGATYPMELYVAVGQNCVEGLGAGVYHYAPREHVLEPVFGDDVREQIAAASLGQGFLTVAPASILMAAEPRRTTDRYGHRGDRYVAMEAGHIGQNIYLQAEALGLGTVAVGAFVDDALATAFRIPDRQNALYLMPLGHVR